MADSIHQVSEESAQPAAPKPPPTADTVTRPRRRLPAWPAIALVVAGIVLGVAGFALARPLLDRKPSYTDQQVSDAKANICGAFDKVRQGVLLNTARSLGEDPIAIFTVAANARIALFDGGTYLSTKLAEEPATAPELAEAVRSLIDSYQQLTVDYLAEVPDLDAQASLQGVDAASAKVSELCQ